MAQLLTVREVAAQLAVSRSSVYKMLEGGVFPQAPVRLPNGSPRWPQEVVDDWVEAHNATATAADTVVSWGRERPGGGAAPDRPGGSDPMAGFPANRPEDVDRGVFPRLPETGSVNHLPARRDCSATATRSPVLQARRGADALRGRSPIAKE